jgi:hypothetical protein
MAERITGRVSTAQAVLLGVHVRGRCLQITNGCRVRVIFSVKSVCFQTARWTSCTISHDCLPAGLVRLQQSDLDQAGGTIILEGGTPSRSINITSGAVPLICCGVHRADTIAHISMLSHPRPHQAPCLP